MNVFLDLSLTSFTLSSRPTAAVTRTRMVTSWALGCHLNHQPSVPIERASEYAGCVRDAGAGARSPHPDACCHPHRGCCYNNNRTGRGPERWSYNSRRG